MGTKKIEAMLDHYAGLQHELHGLAASYDAEEAALMARIAPDIRDALTQLKTHRETDLAAMQQRLADYAATIKRAVAPLGQSVKGATFQAVYTAGRPLWNDAMLQGYALGHPELLDARRVGEPSISLRPVKREGA